MTGEGKADILATAVGGANGMGGGRDKPHASVRRLVGPGPAQAVADARYLTSASAIRRLAEPSP